MRGYNKCVSYGNTFQGRERVEENKKQKKKNSILK